LNKRLAIYIRSVESARGAERVAINVARGLAERGHQVDFLVEESRGWLLEELRDGASNVRIFNLRRASRSSSWAERFSKLEAAAGLLLPLRDASAGRRRTAIASLLHFLYKQDPPIGSLRDYIATEKPGAILSLLNYPNIALLLTATLLRERPRFIVSVHNTLSAAALHNESKWVRSVPKLMRALFGRADAIVAVSAGVAEDVAGLTGIPTNRITTIYNPIFRPDLATLAEAPVDHPWLANRNLPVILGSGKFKPQKDFPTLIRAFARVRLEQAARLIILGEGEAVTKLKELAASLGISDDVDFPGHLRNPFAYYGKASVFVLSSKWEGLPTVIVEAMACGCPVVSTDCRSGPREILEEGRFGSLVPVGAVDEMAQAILATLRSPPAKAPLIERAREFSLDRAVSRYETVMVG
jgi:glycosyltransferase involved in cell wall biosynthesis